MELTWIIGTIVTIIVSGTFGGVLTHFLTKKNVDSLAKANVDLAEAQTKKLEQEVETQYVEQLEKWLVDLRDIHEKHEKSLSEKDQELAALHQQHLEYIRRYDETIIRLDRTGRATQRLMSKADTPYWECDGNGKLTFVNGAWSKLTGLADDESLDTKWMSIIEANDAKTTKLAWYASIADLNDSPIVFSIVNPLTKEKIPVKFIYATIHDTDGKVLKVIGVVLRVHNETSDTYGAK